MISKELSSIPSGDQSISDDFSREVYCFLGFPIDIIEMPSVIRRIELAAVSGSPLLLSTPNLNFLANSQCDPEFQESLLLSDLCIVDGMSVVWSARLMGIPIRRRVAGSDVLAELKAKRGSETPLKLFLFGGPNGVALAASRALNAQPDGVHCVGLLYPGFGEVDELSGEEMIEKINSSGADFLVVALGSKKGQLWLKRNHSRLRVPVRAHFGAALGFEAGTIKRAPRILQKCGLEWLWRIKEEPFLWRRYWHDGKLLASLLHNSILPLAIYQHRLKNHRDLADSIVTEVRGDSYFQIRISGYATKQNIDKIIPSLRNAIAMKQRTVIDLSNTRAIDSRVLGLFLVLRKALALKGSVGDLEFVGLSTELRKVFRLSGVGFLLGAGCDLPFERIAAGPSEAHLGIAASEDVVELETNSSRPFAAALGK
jgi:N-acetylglucosaminyldiphosphoundecaprenol N-acetyl-beta-D-mannosaminyltransferase